MKTFCITWRTAERIFYLSAKRLAICCVTDCDHKEFWSHHRKKVLHNNTWRCSAEDSQQANKDKIDPAHSLFVILMHAGMAIHNQLFQKIYFGIVKLNANYRIPIWTLWISATQHNMHEGSCCSQSTTSRIQNWADNAFTSACFETATETIGRDHSISAYSPYSYIK